jgi:mycothiol synthase
MATRDIVTGLRLRPYAGDVDLVEIARIENEEAETDALPERTSRDELAAAFAQTSASFDPVRDVTLVEIDGRAVAVAFRSAIDTTDGRREYRLHGAVAPAWRRRGIGRALLEENERRLRELAAAEAAPRPLLGSFSHDTQPGDEALLESAGYRRVRWFFDMVRPSLDQVPDLPLPAGLELRPIDASLTRRVWDADIEAFADHWGGFDHSEAHLQRWLESPSNDLSLWLIAFDGDEVAGGVINTIDSAANEAMGIRRGWLSSVFTRRPWRRRGLARALIGRSLRKLRERGMTEAALGVDADNPSGALGLYEDLGFRVAYRASAWRKEL